MTATSGQVITEIITARQSVAPELMNGNVIPDEDIRNLLELARRAPTHGLTEPWRFTIFTGNGKAWFSREHAEMYRKVTPHQEFVQNKFDKILHRADNASHVVAIGVKCGVKSNIPDIEEIASVACAVENMWLGATAIGIACYWGSGGMTYHSLMREFLGLDERDKVLGFLYLGYSDIQPPVTKRSPIGDKVKFVTSG